jgi:hypothetical protein
MGGDMAQDCDEDDDEDGMADVRDEMSAEEIEELDDTLQPVRLVLVKVYLDSLLFIFILTHLPSYANLPTPSRILRPSFFQSGYRF